MLLGRQAVEKLDFEALEMAARERVLQLAARASNNVSMPTPRMKRALVGLAAVAVKRNLWDVAARPFAVYSARCG